MTNRRLLTRLNPPRAVARPGTRQRAVATAPDGLEAVPDSGWDVGRHCVPTGTTEQASARGIWPPLRLRLFGSAGANAEGFAARDGRTAVRILAASQPRSLGRHLAPTDRRFRAAWTG
jgi:hypothetical protein